MNLNEANKILNDNGYLMEDFEENVEVKRYNVLECTFDI